MAAQSRGARAPQGGGRWWRILRGVFGGLRGIRLELSRLADAHERIADYIEALHRQQEEVALQQATPAKEGDIDVTFVQDGEQELWMQVELDLTKARGRMPSEEEVYAEYQRRLPAWVEACGVVVGGVAPAPGSRVE